MLQILHMKLVLDLQEDGVEIQKDHLFNIYITRMEFAFTLMNQTNMDNQENMQVETLNIDGIILKLQIQSMEQHLKTR